MEVWNEPAVLFEKSTMFTKSRFCKIDLRQRLANGRHVRGIQLFAHVGNAVLRQDLSIDADLVIRRRGAAGLCKGQLEIIVTGKAQRTAEP